MQIENIRIEDLQAIVLGGILAIQSFYDLKRKELPVLVTVTGAGIGLLFWIILGNRSITLFAGFLPGILLLLFAKISREAIGYGDGLLIVMMGMYLKINSLISVCMWAFSLAGVVALFLLITAKKKGKQEIPFVPFLLVGFLMEVLLSGT